MSREALVSHSGISERGERVRFAEALAVFEDVHRALKARVAETPEHRALEGLDAALSLVADSTRASHLDLDGFSAFRGSVELLNDNTPESRALDLFEGALRQMIASASDFDDLPDDEDDADDDIAAENEDDAVAGETPVIVTVFEAANEAPAADASPEGDAEQNAEDESAGDMPSDDAEHAAEHEAAHEATITDLHADRAMTAGDTMGAAHESTAESDTAPAEIQSRIEELEAELAAARAHQAA